MLKGRNKFNVWDQNDSQGMKLDSKLKSEYEELDLIKSISHAKLPLLFIRHIYYIRFYQFGYNPVYFNIVRNPVDRFISRYYYIRYGFTKAKIGHNMDENHRNMTLTECVKTEDKECAKPEMIMIPYFCGSSELCLKSGKEALEIAKENILQKYIFVGLTEDYQNTVKALEYLIPKFFSGAGKVYRKINDRLHEKTKSSKHQGTINILSKN